MKVIAAILAIALAATGIAAFRLARELEESRRQVAGLAAMLQQAQATQAAVVGHEPVPAPAPLQPREPDVPGPAPSAAASPDAAREDGVMERIARGAQLLQELRDRPEMMGRTKELARAVIAAANPGIGDALGLSPEETGALLDLLAEQQAGLLGIDTDIPPGDPDRAQKLAAALQEYRRRNEAGLQQLLGGKYERYQDYTRTRLAWQQRQDLRAVLEAEGNPLTADQEKALVEALAAELRNQAPGTAAPLARYSPQQRQRYLDAAAPHLSAQQLESYRKLLERAAAREGAVAPGLEALRRLSPQQSP